MIINKLNRLAKNHNLEIVDCGNGHIQIIGGPLLVNYYPESINRTAYVGGTRQGSKNVTPEQAIKMALTPPPFQPGNSKRSQARAKSNKERLLLLDPHCRWCREPLTTETATLDHVIPLARGGLDNANNMVLACEPCNRKRGHSMPEVKNVPRRP